MAGQLGMKIKNNKKKCRKTKADGKTESDFEMCCFQFRSSLLIPGARILHFFGVRTDFTEIIISFIRISNHLIIKNFLNS